MIIKVKTCVIEWKPSKQAKCKKCRLLGKRPREVDAQVTYCHPLSCLNVYIKVNKQLALTVDWSVLDCSLCGAFCCDAVLLPCCGPSTQVKQLDIITLLVLFCRTPRVRPRRGFFFVVVEVVRILGLSSKGFKYFSSRASSQIEFVKYTHKYTNLKCLKDPMCYIFENQGIQGYQIWHSQWLL